MLYKKSGKPETGDLVLCTVKRILYHSVFVSLDEYNNVEGMVHISEIAPGRIRNLRDYVKEEKRIVCKVLKIDERTGNIDLSLRRVGTGLRIKKLTEYKQEEKAEKLLELIAKETNSSLEQMYKQVGNQAIEDYGSLYEFFQSIVQDPSVVDEYKVSDKLKKILVETVQDKIRPQEVTITATLSLTTTKPDGTEEIKKILLSADKESNIQVTYLGAPKYRIEVTSTDLKSADNTVKQFCENAVKAIQKAGGQGSYQKKHG